MESWRDGDLEICSDSGWPVERDFQLVQFWNDLPNCSSSGIISTLSLYLRLGCDRIITYTGNIMRHHNRGCILILYLCVYLCVCWHVSVWEAHLGVRGVG